MNSPFNQLVFKTEHCFNCAQKGVTKQNLERAKSLNNNKCFGWICLFVAQSLCLQEKESFSLFASKSNFSCAVHPKKCENMSDIEEGQTISFHQAPDPIKELMRNFVRLCTFRTVRIQKWDNLPIELKRQSDGWLLTCRVCPQMECTGFIRDKAAAEPSANKEPANSKG